MKSICADRMQTTGQFGNLHVHTNPKREFLNCDIQSPLRQIEKPAKSEESASPGMQPYGRVGKPAHVMLL